MNHQEKYHFFRKVSIYFSRRSCMKILPTISCSPGWLAGERWDWGAHFQAHKYIHYTVMASHCATAGWWSFKSDKKFDTFRKHFSSPVCRLPTTERMQLQDVLIIRASAVSSSVKWGYQFRDETLWENRNFKLEALSVFWALLQTTLVPLLTHVYVRISSWLVLFLMNN